MLSPEFWFRRQYNIPPSDPRLENISKEEIILEFFCHKLYNKYVKMVEDGVHNPTLDDLLLEEKFEEEASKPEPPKPEPEVLIDIRG